jgi:hypothetical protein
MCSSSDDDDDDDDLIVQKRTHMDPVRFTVGLALWSIMELEGSDLLGIGPNLRKCSVKRDRCRIIEWANTIEDEMFRRQFRLGRLDFFYVLIKIENDLKKNIQQAMNSSGSFVSPYLMLLITLRILARASYLDMIHYHVHVDSVALWCVVGGCYTLISVVLIHQCLLGLLVSAPSLLCEGRGFELPLGRGKTTMLTFGCTLL